MWVFGNLQAYVIEIVENNIYIFRNIEYYIYVIWNMKHLSERSVFPEFHFYLSGSSAEKKFYLLKLEL